jgi:DNA end-binding protein Ku
MARKQKQSDAEEPEQKEDGREQVSRAIWKGSITFGLVNIPVSLHTAEARKEFSFRLLKRENLSPIRYKRVDEAGGKEVEWTDIVHGYEYEPGQFVVINDEDLRQANPKATQTVEILCFVNYDEVSPLFFDKPYYLRPDKRARKSYALLREVLQKTGKVGIARLVLRSREYIAAVLPHENAIVVDLLRYSYELRSAAGLDLPERENLNDGEIRMAEQLVNAMAESWAPDKYRDTYHDDLMEMIRTRIESGQTAEVAEKAPPAEPQGRVVDIMELLKRSVEQKQKRKPEPRRKAG